MQLRYLFRLAIGTMQKGKGQAQGSVQDVCLTQYLPEERPRFLTSWTYSPKNLPKLLILHAVNRNKVMVTGGEIQLGGTKGTFYGFSIINPLLRFLVGFLGVLFFFFLRWGEGGGIILFKEMRHNI